MQNSNAGAALAFSNLRAIDTYVLTALMVLKVKMVEKQPLIFIV